MSRNLIPPISAPLEVDTSPLVVSDRVLIALDFDGVLAPLRDDPDTSRMLDGSHEAIEQLSQIPGTRLALVSGRDATTLRRLARPPRGVWLVGSHGAETELGDGTELRDGPEAALGAAVHRGGESSLGSDMGPGVELKADERESLELLDDFFATVTDPCHGYSGPDVRIEKKPYSRTIHTRGLDRVFVDDVKRRLEEFETRVPQLRTIQGHDIVEYSVKHTTKGDGLALLARACGPEAILYIGDDITDEDAFAEIENRSQSVSIKVGQAPTRATWRIENPEAVETLLGHLAEDRSRAFPV